MHLIKNIQRIPSLQKSTPHDRNSWKGVYHSWRSPLLTHLFWTGDLDLPSVRQQTQWHRYYICIRFWSWFLASYHFIVKLWKKQNCVLPARHHSMLKLLTWSWWAVQLIWAMRADNFLFLCVTHQNGGHSTERSNSRNLCFSIQLKFCKGCNVSMQKNKNKQTKKTSNWPYYQG